MAKKKGGKSKGYISAGVHSNVATKTKRAVKNSRSYADRLLSQHAAHTAGKHVMLTIENPDKTQTNKQFIRVPAKQVWRNPNNPGFTIR